MRHTKALSLLLILTLLLSVFSIVGSAAASKGIINGSDGSLNMRDAPNSSTSKIIAVIPNGTVVDIISTSGNYYYISYTDSAGKVLKGYVYSAYVILEGESDNSAYISSNIPAVYKSYISQLKAKHPNWQFKFYYTGLDWKSVVEAECYPGRNAIAGAPLSYRSTSSKCSITGEQYVDGYILSDYIRREGGSYIVSTSGSNLIMRSGAGTGYLPVASIPNNSPVYVQESVNDSSGKFWYKARYYTSYGTYIYSTVEGKSWFQPHGQVVRYYLDPRNFLDESNIFQFEQLAYDSGVHNVSGVNAIIKNSFMINTNIGTTDNRNISYAQAIMEAASTYNVSPYHLASRIIQEVGRNGSVASKGNSATYPGIYNFYNIGAYTGVTDGLKWASEGTTYWRPWDSQYKSIMGGAQYIASGFINRGQSTLYFQKFDVVSNGGKYYDHQYMSNIVAPSTEGVHVYKAYKDLGIVDSNFVFLIPVYNNMPSFAYPLPASYNYPNMLPDSDPGYIQQFSDVNVADWYFDAVKFVSDNGYMNGYGNGRFGVTDPIKREDYAIVLSRIAGADLSIYTNADESFPDVSKSAYYFSAVSWANENGIITGYNNGKYGTGDNITREQVCTIIYRYALSIYCDGSLSKGVDEILSKFSDNTNISDYAKTAVAWCVEHGIVSGNKNGLFNPQEAALRAEMAVMVQRMVESGLYYPGFPDVSMGTWYYDAVKKVFHKGLLSGYANGKFGPSDGIQRQDFVVIISRINPGIDNSDEESSSDNTASISFPDVAASSYYYDAVMWAVKSGIITGYNNGKFGVGDKITRQDVCTIIYRYLIRESDEEPLSETEINKILGQYGDANQIMQYARLPMAWCIKYGVLSGKNSTTLAPLSNISRAETAKVFANMLENELI